MTLFEENALLRKLVEIRRFRNRIAIAAKSIGTHRIWHKAHDVLPRARRCAQLRLHP